MTVEKVYMSVNLCQLAFTLNQFGNALAEHEKCVIHVSNSYRSQSTTRKCTTLLWTHVERSNYASNNGYGISSASKTFSFLEFTPKYFSQLFGKCILMRTQVQREFLFSKMQKKWHSQKKNNLELCKYWTGASANMKLNNTVNRLKIEILTIIHKKQ